MCLCQSEPGQPSCFYGRPEKHKLGSGLLLPVKFHQIPFSSFNWFVVLRINVASAVFQPYLDLEAGDNQSLKIHVARPGIKPRSLALQAKCLTTRHHRSQWFQRRCRTCLSIRSLGSHLDFPIGPKNTKLGRG